MMEIKVIDRKKDKKQTLKDLESGTIFLFADEVDNPEPVDFKLAIDEPAPSYIFLQSGIATTLSWDSVKDAEVVVYKVVKPLELEREE